MNIRPWEPRDGQQSLAKAEARVAELESERDQLRARVAYYEEAVCSKGNPLALRSAGTETEAIQVERVASRRWHFLPVGESDPLDNDDISEAEVARYRLHAHLLVYGACRPGCNWNETNNVDDCDCGWQKLHVALRDGDSR